jgi:hypothetical protein
MTLLFVPSSGGVAMKTAKSAEGQDPKPPTLADYEAWKEEQIRLGLEDFEQGRFCSHEEAEKQIEATMRRLKKKYAKAA